MTGCSVLASPICTLLCVVGDLREVVVVVLLMVVLMVVVVVVIVLVVVLVIVVVFETKTCIHCRIKTAVFPGIWAN